MSKDEARKAYDLLRSAPNRPDFVITYAPFSLFRDRPEKVFRVSEDLRKFFPATDIDLDQCCLFEGDKITFFYPDNQSFPAKHIQSDWGSQYFVDYAEPDFSDRLKGIGKLLKIAKDFGGALAALVVFLITAFGSIRTELIKVFPVKPVPDSKDKEIAKVLEQAYYNLPHPKPNGIFYWEYSQSCTVRRFHSGFSPTLKDSTFDGISSRRTDEKGWKRVLKDHTSGNPSRITFDDLPDGNALKNTMRELNVFEVISVPLTPSGCPKGYVSGGFPKELSDSSYRAFIAELTRTAVKLADFY